VKQLEQEVSNRRQVEETLRARTQELETLLDLIPVPIWIASDPHCLHIRGNRTAAKLWGAPQEANLSRTPPPGEDAIVVRCYQDGRELKPEELPMQRTAATGEPQAVSELELDALTGKRLTISGRAVPLHDGHGKVRGVIAAFLDVTEHKQAERALRRERELLLTIIDRIPVMITRYEPDTNVLRLNPEFERVVGWTTEEAAGISLMEACYFDPAYREQVRQFMESCRDGWMDIRMRTRDGRDIETSWANLRLSDGTQVGIGIDITERKQAEAKLHRRTERLGLPSGAAEELLRADNTDAMLRKVFARIAPHLGLDAYFNFMVNEGGDALQLESCQGIPEEEVQKLTRLEFGQAICGNVALRCQPIVATHIQQSDDPVVRLVESFGLRAYACNALQSGDKLLGTLSFASRSRDEFDARELEFLQTICHYVTVAYERVRLIQQLREADRRKDEFPAMLAHELRNPLAPIRNSLPILRVKGPTAEDLADCRDMIDRQVTHLVRLVDDLLDVSRGKIRLHQEPLRVIPSRRRMTAPGPSNWPYGIDLPWCCSTLVCPA
jgi:PAS domain S-box-containing protein